MSIKRSLETMPIKWFPDRATVQAFVRGPRYYSLGSLVMGAFESELPEALAARSRTAAYFIGQDLFELARIAALPDDEPFEAQENPGAYSDDWRESLSLLVSVALVGTYVEEIFDPIIEMQAEAEAERDALEIQAAKEEMAARRKSWATAEQSPTADA